MDEEFLAAYGDQAWFSTKYDFPLLQKAVWRYRHYIDISPSEYWSDHPLAHELFNTTFNGQLPFTFTHCPCFRCRDHPERRDASPLISDDTIQTDILSNKSHQTSPLTDIPLSVLAEQQQLHLDTHIGVQLTNDKNVLKTNRGFGKQV